MWKRFQPGEGPSRDLLHESENVADGLFAALERSDVQSLLWVWSPVDVMEEAVETLHGAVRVWLPLLRLGGGVREGVAEAGRGEDQQGGHGGQGGVRDPHCCWCPACCALLHTPYLAQFISIYSHHIYVST